MKTIKNLFFITIISLVFLSCENSVSTDVDVIGTSWKCQYTEDEVDFVSKLKFIDSFYVESTGTYITGEQYMIKYEYYVLANNVFILDRGVLVAKCTVDANKLTYVIYNGEENGDVYVFDKE